MQNYRQLSVWKKAHAAALNIHRLTKEIPREGNAELINQIRRASLSIPANIAEGTSRPTDKDFAKFLHVALGSTTETEYHLEFAADTEIISRREFSIRQEELIEIRKMLHGLIKRIRATKPS
jgi:four helix bundle protein